MDNLNATSKLSHSDGAGQVLNSIASESDVTQTKKDYPKLWFGYLVHAIKRKFYHSYQQKRNKIVGEIFDSCCNNKNGYVLRTEAGQAQYGKEYYHKLDQYKVALALHVIKLGKITSKKSNDESISLNLGSSNDKIRAGSDKAVGVLRKPITEIMNDMLIEGRTIPEKFIQCALAPHLAEIMIQRFGFDPEIAMTKVKNAMANSEINKEGDITFERIVMLKNKLGFHRSELLEKQNVSDEPSLSGEDNIDQPWLNAPNLQMPQSSSYHLDDEDREYIKKMVEMGKGIQLAWHDRRNRVKRLVLRNKRTALSSTIGTVLSITFGAVITGGPGGAIGAAIRAITTMFSIIGVKALINAIRVSRNIKAMEKYSNYNNFPDKASGVLGYNRKRHKKFLDAAKLVCSKKSLADTYNMFSELEKDVGRLEKKIKYKEKNTSIDTVIEQEELVVRCRHRNNELNKSMQEFIKLYMSGIESLRQMEEKGDEYKKIMWDNLFRDMDPKKRAEYIKEASKDPKLVDKRYRFQEENVPCEEMLFGSRMNNNLDMGYEESGENINEEGCEKNQKISLDSNEVKQAKVRSLLPVSCEKKPAEYIKRRPFFKKITKWSKVIGLNGFIKISYVMRAPSFIGTGEVDLADHVPIGWSNPVLEKEMLEVLPKLSSEGALIFGGLVFGEVFIEAINEKQRHARLKRIQLGEDTYSGVGFFKRKRTKREEINTLRESAKVKLSDFVKTIKKTSKKHELVNNKLEDLKKISELRGEKPFQGLDADEEYQCILLMMRRELYRQILNHKIMGSIGLFYERVKTYQDVFNKRISESVVAS